MRIKIVISQPQRPCDQAGSFPNRLVLIGAVAGLLFLSVVVIGAAVLIFGERPSSMSRPDRAESRETVGASDVFADLVAQQPDETAAAEDQGIDAKPPAINDEAIRIAVEFIQHAQLRDTPQALGLIDRQLFERRLLGPEGSHEAVAFGLSSDQVLDRLSQYSLEGTGKSGGRRHWRLLSPSSFGGLPAIMVRYHSEAESASSALLAIKKDHKLVADLFPWDEFEPYAAVLACHQKFPEIRVAMLGAPSRVSELVAQFRRDFEYDLGGDLTVLSVAWAPDQVGPATQLASRYVPSFKAAQAGALRDCADYLYRLTEDPFLLAVQAHVARVGSGDREWELRIYREAQASGYESVAMFQAFLADAIESGEKGKIQKALGELSDYWGAFPLSKSSSQYTRLASMWEFHRLKNMTPEELAELIPQPQTSNLGPSVEEMTKESNERMKRMEEKMNAMMDDLRRQGTATIREIRVPRIGK